METLTQIYQEHIRSECTNAGDSSFSKIGDLAKSEFRTAPAKIYGVGVGLPFAGSCL